MYIFKIEPNKVNQREVKRLADTIRSGLPTAWPDSLFTVFFRYDVYEHYSLTIWAHGDAVAREVSNWLDSHRGEYKRYTNTKDVKICQVKTVVE